MSDQTAMDLQGTMDAQKWTTAFLHYYPDGCNDPGTMLGWFANAIMVGYDHAKRESQAERDALAAVAEAARPIIEGWFGSGIDPDLFRPLRDAYNDSLSAAYDRTVAKP